MNVQLDKKTVKAMASKVRSFVQGSQGQCTQAQAYEFLAHLFNLKDWNTLSSMLVDPSAEEPTKTLLLECGSDHPFAELPDYARLILSPSLIAKIKTASISDAPISRIPIESSLFSVCEESLLVRRFVQTVELYCSSKDKEWWLSFELISEDIDGKEHSEFFTTPIHPINVLDDVMTAPVSRDIVYRNNQVVTWKNYCAVTLGEDPFMFMDRLACYELNDDLYNEWQEAEVR